MNGQVIPNRMPGPAVAGPSPAPAHETYGEVEASGSQPLSALRVTREYIGSQASKLSQSQSAPSFPEGTAEPGTANDTAHFNPATTGLDAADEQRILEGSYSLNPQQVADPPHPPLPLSPQEVLTFLFVRPFVPSPTHSTCIPSSVWRVYSRLRSSATLRKCSQTLTFTPWCVYWKMPLRTRSGKPCWTTITALVIVDS